MNIIFESERLIFREWEAEDITPFTEINQDPKVMEYFPSLGDRDKSAYLIGRWCQHYDDHGFMMYPLILKETGDFIGFTGIQRVPFKASFTPAIEIGWRIASKYWGKAYAPEAAKKVIEVAFNQFNIDEIVAFTTKNNMKSRRVMEKIGMQHDASSDFLHPSLNESHPLAPHVLYRLKKEKLIKDIIDE